MTAPFVQNPVVWSAIVAGFLFAAAILLWRSRTVGADRIRYMIAATIPALLAVATICWLIRPDWFP